ncbi:MAG: DUF6036 family nucleotidyltransferase [Pyrinomonadaceae bacterium]
MSPDFKEILSTFNEHEVRYLVVGAYAVMKYAEPRYTKDLDIWVEASGANAKRVFSALDKFGAPLKSVSENDFASDGFFQMGRPPVRIDVMMSIDGVQFENAWPNREDGDFDGVRAHFISRTDLITNKMSSARPQDLIDIDSMNTPRLKLD